MTVNRISHEFSNVGTSWSKERILTPKKYRVLRVRASMTGSGNQVALRIEEETTNNVVSVVLPVHIALEYDLTVSPLDAVESVDDIIVVPKRTANQLGLSYISVRCDSGSNNSVVVEIDIEVAD